MERKVRRYSKLYVGVRREGIKMIYERFRSFVTPSPPSHPQYIMVIGPFRTVAGADYMVKYGYNNPHCQCVNDAERLAKANG